MRHMNELPSRQFRSTYPRLTEAVLVTVNGHVIGRWTPIGAKPTDVAELPSTVVIEGRTYGVFRDSRVDHQSRPFTPAPKPGKR